MEGYRDPTNRRYLRGTLYLENPYNEPNPLKLFTKVNEVGIVAAFNICRDGISQVVEVKPADALPDHAQRYAVYMYFGDELKIVRSDEILKKEIGEIDCELFIISPIKEGFAPIGMIDIFMAPKGLLSARRGTKKY